MGCQRAGWYSWDRLDNAGKRSADRIVPELQQLAVGDVLPWRGCDIRIGKQAAAPEPADEALLDAHHDAPEIDRLGGGQRVEQSTSPNGVARGQ
jgi:hypothetical protein